MSKTVWCWIAADGGGDDDVGDEDDKEKDADGSDDDDDDEFPGVQTMPCLLAICIFEGNQLLMTFWWW